MSCVEVLIFLILVYFMIGFTTGAAVPPLATSCFVAGLVELPGCSDTALKSLHPGMAFGAQLHGPAHANTPGACTCMLILPLLRWRPHLVAHCLLVRVAPCLARMPTHTHKPRWYLECRRDWLLSHCVHVLLTYSLGPSRTTFQIWQAA